MELDYFIGQPCKKKTAFQFKPKKQINLNLEEIVEKLSEKYEIQINSKILVIVIIDKISVSIFPSGKIMVRGIKNKEQAEEIFKKTIKPLKEMLK